MEENSFLGRDRTAEVEHGTARAGLEGMRPAMPTPDDHALVRRMKSIFPLSDEHADAISAMPMAVKNFGADQDIVRQGDKPSQVCLVISGIAAMYKITGPGRRQIMSFYVPGDVPDLHSIHLSVMDSTIATMTPATLGVIQHDTVHDICRRIPALADAFWKMTLIDSAVFREWIVNVGQREALVRLAHLLCEMFLRLKVVGLVNGATCDFPVTQQELADATGISVVHVNRMLQELRGQGLISLNQRKLTILDWQALTRVGDFDPTYLHLASYGD